MAIELLALVVVVVGIGLSCKLKGPAARKARKWYVISLLLALGGCMGTLSWLDAETSGSANFAGSVNPFIWAGLFTIGMLIMFVNSIMVIGARSSQKAASTAVKPDSKGSRDF